MLDDCDIFWSNSILYSTVLLYFWNLDLQVGFDLSCMDFFPLFKICIILTPKSSFDKSCHKIHLTWYFFYFQEAN